MSDRETKPVFTPFRFTARTPKGDEIACAIIPVPTHAAGRRRAGPFIQSFAATSSESPMPSSELKARAEQAIYLEWNVQGEGSNPVLSIEAWKAGAWEKLSEEPVDASAPFLEKKLPALPAGQAELMLRYSLRLAPDAEPKQVVVTLRGDPPPVQGTPGFLTLQGIVTELKQAQQVVPGFKLAITTTGGGARGAWEAGAAEALLGVLVPMNIQPDIVAGSSAGSLVATGLFIDLVRPWNHNGGISPFAGRQSDLWKALWTGNHGADQVAGPDSIYIKWGGGERGAEAMKQLVLIAENVKKAAKAADRLVKGISKTAGDLPSGPKVASDFVAERVLARLKHQPPDPFLIDDLNSLGKAMAALKAAQDRLDLGGMAKAVENAIAATARITGRGVIDDAIARLDVLEELMAEVPKSVLRLAESAGQLVLDVTDFGIQLGALEEHLGRELAMGGELGSLAGRVAIDLAVKIDHLIDHGPLRSVITRFFASAFPTTGSLDTAVLDGWQERRKPELLLTGADLTAERLVVFALAGKQSVQRLAGRGIWTVDLTNRVSQLDDPLRGRSAGRARRLEQAVWQLRVDRRPPIGRGSAA